MFVNYRKGVRGHAAAVFRSGRADPGSATMTEKSTNRRWSTKTLAKQLIGFLKAHEIDAGATVEDLLNSLRDQIVNDEVGEELEL